jgi:hypothetical protein
MYHVYQIALILLLSSVFCLVDREKRTFIPIIVLFVRKNLKGTSLANSLITS